MVAADWATLSFVMAQGPKLMSSNMGTYRMEILASGSRFSPSCSGGSGRLYHCTGQASTRVDGILAWKISMQDDIAGLFVYDRWANRKILGASPQADRRTICRGACSRLVVGALDHRPHRPCDRIQPTHAGQRSG